MSNPPKQPSPQSNYAQKSMLRFYRNRRSFYSILLGIVAFFITEHAFPAIVAYVLSVLFWDWIYFTQRGYKDSEQAPETYFASIGITPNQIDEFNNYMVKIRIAAFAGSMSACATCILFFPKVIFQAVFVVTYFCLNFGLMFIAHRQGKIIWPYESDHIVTHKFEYPPMLMVRKCHYDPSSDNPMVNPFYTSVKKPRSYLD